MKEQLLENHLTQKEEQEEVSDNSFTKEVHTAIEKIFKEEDTYEVMEANIDNSIELGKKASEFLNRLNKESLYKRNKDYDFKTKKSPDLEVDKKLIRSFKKNNDDKDMEAYTCQRLKQNATEVKEKLVHETVDGHQLVKFNHKHEEGENIIKEEVINRITDEMNYAFSNLMVKSAKSGLSLDLNQLLPKGYKFSLDETNPSSKTKKGQEIYLKRKKYDLKNYNGMKSIKDDNFYCYSPTKEVSYGDLTKKGGLLKLLHEISHSWQSEYHEDLAKKEYIDFYNKVKNFLNIYYQSNLHKPEMTEIHKKNNITLKKHAKKLGFEINDDYEDVERRLEDDEITIKIPELNKSFVVKSNKMKELIKNFQYEERNAWAHAIKLLRFFKRNGIDLEPELKSLDDIKNIVNDCLKSYQDNLDKQIEPNKKRLKFLYN